MSIGKRVRRIREHYGLTHYGFSNRLQEKENRVKSVEYNKQRAPGEFLAKIVEEFKIDAHWLLTGKGSMHIEGANILQETPPCYSSSTNDSTKTLRQARLMAFIEYWVTKKSNEDHIWLEGQLKRSVPEYSEFILEYTSKRQ